MIVGFVIFDPRIADTLGCNARLNGLDLSTGAQVSLGAHGHRTGAVSFYGRRVRR